MNDVKKESKRNAKLHENEVSEESAVDAEMQELKREMQSAKAADWAQKNQQKLIALAVAVVVSLIGASLWLENSNSQRHAAATLYHQALASNDDTQKKALLETVINDYNASGYAFLAHMQLAKGDDIEIHLQALAHDSDVPQEMAWQARLDLAEVALNKGNVDAAQTLLSETTGKQFEQLRFYLLSQTSSNTSEQQGYLQKALDSISNDEALKTKVEQMLSALMDSASLTQ